MPTADTPDRCWRCGNLTGASSGHKAPRGAGYLLDEAEIIFWDLCPPCRTSPRHHDQTRPTKETP